MTTRIQQSQLTRVANRPNIPDFWDGSLPLLGICSEGENTCKNEEELVPWEKDLRAPYGGQIWPAEVPDPPGTLFTLIPCPNC